ncbi:xylulokinase [Algisphaera agarilytica]|uniref:Xylulokinase n=1 Tax=Algisphaera agarilytica TaxID=1385975 RepID=A0A7X0H812_9BACT|nr:FGGY family carbohydrate kinase [Algisphaera agarilytica]MBB6430973.1 xylulokinase [Algisphaera agarilytica]
MVLLGIDLGSSSVKAALVQADTGQILATGQYPPTEMAIDASQPGWAEQDPETWWDAARRAVGSAMSTAGIAAGDVKAVGVAYQMHGLVCLDKAGQSLRPSIIWCDSRAVEIGNDAFEALGSETCLPRLLNSPGNFTASKLRWVQQNQPELFEQIDKVCLPGDYLASRLTGQTVTTVSGLSEGMLWDFQDKQPASVLLDHYGVPENMLADRVQTFGLQGELTAQSAELFGLSAGTPVTYRAGDQPNNALSLNVLNAGEIAATAGTSGVVYGVADTVKYDPQSRINSFAHVNHADDDPRLGLLLCINGTGIANAWGKRMVGGDLDYVQLNDLAEQAPVGSDGLSVLPFGNGAERMLGNAEVGGHLGFADFNRHGREHIARAVQEGIAFSFAYGMDILRETGVDLGVIRAGRANLFLSPLFRQTLANIADCQIELYETDGAVGAARGAGIGAGIYASPEDAFANLERVGGTDPNSDEQTQTRDAYTRWSEYLQALL